MILKILEYIWNSSVLKFFGILWIVFCIRIIYYKIKTINSTMNLLSLKKENLK